MSARMGKARKSGQPAGATARKIGILLDLLRNRRASVAALSATYGASDRTIARDLQELRAIGETAGFKISKRDGDAVVLEEFKSRPAGLIAAERKLYQLINEIFKAFGEPLQQAAGGMDEAPANGDVPFLHVVQPQLENGSAIGKIYSELESAWLNRARVAFTYKGEERTVEPGAAMYRSGRYYLVARDVAKGAKGWRLFAMDRIGGPIRRAGSITNRVPAPARYLSTDTIGWFKGDGNHVAVDVTLSKELAPSATSRRWQREQKVLQHKDGTATLRLSVDDVDEVIRWAFGYGDEAWISAPPEAAARARAMLDRMLRRYRE